MTCKKHNGSEVRAKNILEENLNRKGKLEIMGMTGQNNIKMIVRNFVNKYHFISLEQKNIQ